MQGILVRSTKGAEIAALIKFIRLEIVTQYQNSALLCFSAEKHTLKLGTIACV